MKKKKKCHGATYQIFPQSVLWPSNTISCIFHTRRESSYTNHMLQSDWKTATQPPRVRVQVFNQSARKQISGEPGHCRDTAGFVLSDLIKSLRQNLDKQNDVFHFVFCLMISKQSVLIIMDIQKFWSSLKSRHISFSANFNFNAFCATFCLIWHYMCFYL